MYRGWFWVAAFSILEEEKSNAMEKVINEMAVLHSVHALDPPDLADDPKGGAEEDFSGKVDLVLTEFLLSVQKHCDIGRAPCDSCWLEDMQEATNVLPDVTDLEAHVHVLSLSYIAQWLIKSSRLHRKHCFSTAEGPAVSESDSEIAERVDVLLVFEKRT